MLLDNAGQIQAFLKQWFELRRDRPPVFSDDLLRYLEPPDAIDRYGFQYYYAQPIFDQQDQYDFSRRYSAEFGGAPQGSSAAVAYDETRILLSCIAQNPLVTAVRECISNTDNYQGASGTFSFAGRQTVRDRRIGMQRLF